MDAYRQFLHRVVKEWSTRCRAGRLKQRDSAVVRELNPADAFVVIDHGRRFACRHRCLREAAGHEQMWT